MVLLRRILSSVLLFSFCLIVCVLPVSAGVLDTFSCVVNLEPQTFGYRANSLTSNTQWGFSSVPASFSYSYDSGTNNYVWSWDKATALTGYYSLVTAANKEISFIVNIGDGSSDLDVDLNFCSFDFLMRCYSGSTTLYEYYGLLGRAELMSDNGDIIHSVLTDSFDNFPVFEDLSFSCNQYFTITFYSTDELVTEFNNNSDTIDQAIEAKLELSVNGDIVVPDDITIQIGQINDSLDNIEITVSNIEDGVVDIHEQLVDMGESLDNIESDIQDTHDQLENPNSSIWNAAGEKISDTLTDLFVPSSNDLESVKSDFDNLARDKLGGAYTAMETVENTFTDLNNKLDHPNTDASFEFPGISVPLGGDVGTVELVQAQLVSMPVQVRDTLHPICTIIIPIICAIGTFNSLKDMVECFLSGYSYAEFLHRNKGGSE